MSRYRDLIDRAKHRAPEPDAPAEARPAAPPTRPPAPPDTPPAPPKRGRPAGKKSKVGKGDQAGEFSQATCYVRTDTRVRVDIALGQEALERGTRRREFSELVQELLDAWLKSRG
jgi:hypothetical protein